VTAPPYARPGTLVSRIIKAPRSVVYRACLDPAAVARWRVPADMKSHVHTFDAREGGWFRISLTYRDPARSPNGKTSDDTDTFHGRFIELVPFEKIVELIEFEASDGRFSGAMTMITSLADADGGTEITIICRDIPVGIRPEDNVAGCRSALRNLAALLA
jgi:uncharacterized protein YndB with AHSA1/START domain